MRLWALAGGVFGLVSVLAGARVLAGLDTPDYVVLRWLVAYNMMAGLAGLGVAAALWIGRGWGPVGARLIAAAHAAVLAALVVMRIAEPAVATDSLAAMSFRAALWLVIAVVASRATRTSP